MQSDDSKILYGRAKLDVHTYRKYLVDTIPGIVEKDGLFKASMVNSNSYGWEQAYFVAMNMAMSVLKDKGYICEKQNNHDVIDVTIWKIQ